VLAVMHIVAFALAVAVRVPAPRVEPAAEPPGNALSDAEMRTQIEAYLGSIDTPIRPEQWQALGPRANGVLAGIVRGNAELPTRRAKAVDGLAALNGPGAAALFSEVAARESESATVRLAAVRGLGRVASDPAAALRPLMRNAKDSRVRASAADQLVQRTGKSACSVVRAQAARENGHGRIQFERALSRCAE
jgi:HEAT repeat protein